MMKKIIKTLPIAATLFAGVARANSDINNILTNNVNNSAAPRKDIPTLIAIGINALLGIAATVAVLFIIIGAVQYLAATGNPDSIQRAKSTILYAVLGLILAILGYAIVFFITSKLV